MTDYLDFMHPVFHVLTSQSTILLRMKTENSRPFHRNTENSLNAISSSLQYVDESVTLKLIVNNHEHWELLKTGLICERKIMQYRGWITLLYRSESKDGVSTAL